MKSEGYWKRWHRVEADGEGAVRTSGVINPCKKRGNYGILAAEQSAGEGADKEGERRLPDENKGIQLYCTKTDGKRNQSGIYRDRGRRHAFK